MQRFLIPNLCLSLFLLASCEQAEVSTNTPEDGSVFQVASVDLNGGTHTRTIITGIESDPGSGLNANGKISRLGMYAIYANGSEYKPSYGRNTATYVNTSGKWKPDASLAGDETLRLPTGAVYVYAWHPYSLQPSYNNGSFYIGGVELCTEDDFKATAQTDYLYAAGCNAGGNKVTVTSQNNPGLRFTLKHALTKLTFSMKKDASIESTETLTLTQLVLKSYGNNFLTGSGVNRRMSLADGTLSGLVATEKLTYEGSLALTFGYQDITALVAPITGMQRFSFELTVTTGGGEIRKYQTQALNVSTTWEAGKNYVYKLKVDKMSAVLEGPAKVYEWTDEKNDIHIQ